MRSLHHAAIVALAIAGCAPALAQTARYKDWAEIEGDLVEQKMLHRQVPMRDGVQLDANIYLPHGKPPFPVVVYRSPYLQEIFLTPGALPPNDLNAELLANGYAIVHENERGRYWSGGDYEYLANAGADGYDTIDWIAKQPWSNGKVGTYGCSSTAENQFKLNSAAHPAHAAAIALGPGAGIGKIGPYSEQGNTFRGGALQLLFASWYRGFIFYGKYGDPRPQYPEGLSADDRERLGEVFRLHPNRADYQTSGGFDYEKYFAHLPVLDLNKAVNGPRTEWERFSRRTPADPAWRELALSNEGDKFGVPMLWGFSWYDVSVAPNVALYNYARDNTSTDRARNAQQMFIGPTSHCMFGGEKRQTIVGARDLGDARYDYIARFMEWYDYWLKGVAQQGARAAEGRLLPDGRQQMGQQRQLSREGHEGRRPVSHQFRPLQHAVRRRCAELRAAEAIGCGHVRLRSGPTGGDARRRRLLHGQREGHGVLRSIDARDA